jgi:hypothetical protein
MLRAKSRFNLKRFRSTAPLFLKNWFLKNWEAAVKSYSANGVAMAFVLATVLSVGAPARGQTPAIPTQSTINLTLEQRRNIKELIKDLDVPSVAPNVDTAVGATVPASIKLSPMPADVAAKVPQVKAHMFFIQNTKVVIVDPKDNKIVDAID